MHEDVPDDQPEFIDEPRHRLEPPQPGRHRSDDILAGLLLGLGYELAGPDTVRGYSSILCMYATEQTTARRIRLNAFAEDFAVRYVVSKTILLIQDDCRDAHFVREALIHSSDGPFRVEWVRLCSEGLKRLAEEDKLGGQPADVIAAVLVDLFLPDSRGIETFDCLFRLAPHIPILVLSASQDEDVAKLAVQRGAQDYLLTAHLDGHLLPKTLRSMVERAANAEALFEEKERAQVTLNSIGDAVISTDVGGRVTYLNTVAESMTGWSLEEGVGRPLEDVFHIPTPAPARPCRIP